MKTKSDKPPVSMSRDTSHFLETLLFVADNTDYKDRPLQGASIHDFHPEFIEAVNGCCAGFRDHLETLREFADNPEAAELWEPDAGERSFGGNVFFSLSGHGCGFRDDRDSEWGKTMDVALVTYSGDTYRFEGLESNLMKRDGKIHLALRTRTFQRAALARLFTVTRS